MTTILPGHTYDIEGVGPAVIDEIRSINGEARIKALPLGVGDVPADELADSRISQDELKSLFGDELPDHVVKILFPEKSEPLTLDELRVVLRALTSPPSPVGADDGLVATTSIDELLNRAASKIACDEWFERDNNDRSAFEVEQFMRRVRKVLLDAACELAKPYRERAETAEAHLTSAPQPAKDGWWEALPAGVLCYVAGETAYFTTRTLDKQWGDDWNDAPYEHNAGPPYEWREGSSSEAPYQIAILKFSGPFSTPADIAGSNSRYSVQMINSGACAWLVADDPKYRSIPAGITAAQFADLMQAAGGTVYLAATLSHTEQAAPADDAPSLIPADVRAIADKAVRQAMIPPGTEEHRRAKHAASVAVLEDRAQRRASLSAPITIRNEEARFTETVNEDVPTVTRPADEVLVTMDEPRRVVGYRVYDKPAPARGGVEPVAWRWKQKDGRSHWAVDTQRPNLPTGHFDIEPLYRAPLLSAPSAPVEANRVTDDISLLGGSTTAYTRDQLAKLIFAIFYSANLCAPENIANVIKEIDTCEGGNCEHNSRSTCRKFERGEYCPFSLAEDLGQVSLALFGPRDPSHYVESVFGPDHVSALQAAPVQQQTWRPMESAPKDGTRLLVSIPRYGAMTAHWDDRWHLHACINRDAAPAGWMPLPTNSEAGSNG